MRDQTFRSLAPVDDKLWISVMMTAGRFVCAVTVVIAASLTPSGCSNVAEPAMATESVRTMWVEEPADYFRTQHNIDLESDADSDEIGS